jgi:hypothetical protein
MIMATTYVLSLGYNGNSVISEANQWLMLKRAAETLCSTPAWREHIMDEAVKYNCPSFDENGILLSEYILKFQIPCTDCTIMLDNEEHKIRLVASGGSLSRIIKTQLRRAFCRLIINQMHKANIEVNLVVV